MDDNIARTRINRVAFFRFSEAEFLLTVAGAIGTAAQELGWEAMSDAQAAVWCWSRLIVDVPNGGFEQFFYNSRDQVLVARLCPRLNTLGLDKMGIALRQALAVYHAHEAQFWVDNPWDSKLFGSIKEFEKLERVFAQQALKTTRAMEQWARKNVGKLGIGDDDAAIDPAFTGAIEINHPNGVVAERLEVKKGKPSGAYREFFDDGTVRQVMYYKAGKISGDYWPNGQLKNKESKRGAEKVIEWFYPSSKLQKRMILGKSGLPTGTVQLFHENGQLAEEVGVREGENLGTWVKFFEDGSPKLQAEWLEDREFRIDNAWDDERRQVVRNSTGVFDFDHHDISSSSKPWWNFGYRDVIELKDHQKHGKSISYRNGVLASVLMFENGIKHGESMTYWDNGRVNTAMKYVNGEEMERAVFSKFDNPAPATVIKLEANEELYEAWKHIRVDEFPRALNLEMIERRLEIPRFLREVEERNRTGTIKTDYEDWNRFNDGITYFVEVGVEGKVTEVYARGSGVYSGGHWETYRPLLEELRFSPGRVRGRAVPCRVVASVRHTFVERASV